ncbi:MAG: hypothetical protein IT463_08520 [Planctomycetes bacterium]|nr:hypothetical protein [Planctomycetota bacterium]
MPRKSTPTMTDMISRVADYAQELLEKPNRTQAEEEGLLYAAFAQAFLAQQGGNEPAQARAEWLISRAYSVLGNGRESERHAKLCLELTERNRSQMRPLDTALAYEAMARAAATEGDSQALRHYHARAAEAGAAIENEAERRRFEAELKGGNWWGLV